MCGICGLFSYGRVAEDGAAHVVRMRDAMEHRGPDDAGLYQSADRRVVLGHRRLSIVDLSPAGHQPMSNEDGTVWIAFNGEIYNHAELRPALEARGHRYRSRSDTETLLHLYEEHGPEMLPLLRGMFAFAIWDANERRLFLARDRIGIKPLYYTFAGGRFLFGSEIKALLAHPAVERDLDTEALYHYLSYYTTPAPRTMFRGVSKLPAGHFMLVDERGEATVRRWWDAADAPAPDSTLLADEDTVAGEVQRLLGQAVQERLMADVPFGVFLSGGVDSSAITALVRRMHDGPVRTFSVGYADAPEHDELGPARRVAQLLGTDHHEVEIDHDDLVAYVPELIHSQDEPLADWVCIPLYYVSKLVRDSGTIVALVGEGSDEQFAGYRHYLRYLRLQRGAWSAYGRLPGWARRGAHRLGEPALRRANFPREIRELVRRAAMDEPLFLSGAVAAWETDKREMMSARMRSGEWASLSSVPVAQAAAAHFRSRRPGADFLDGVTYQELQLRLPELLLMRVDKITMSTSIEARVPFLDHRLVEFTAHVPSAMKIRGGRTKHILKHAVRDLLPADVIDRKKQGFSAPVKEWFRGELAGYARRSILESRLRERDLFDYDVVSNMLEMHRTGRRNYDTLLWSLVNLSQWYDGWIASEPERALAAV
ncbi:MAG TPA: asparagine synthase (glutamine-hydrolyzing) [Longimicrobiaceae bacterium]|nr:asparagine synthase (glutamine-hydrolyzing) [Longimicrobiaceae bacterium]